MRERDSFTTKVGVAMQCNDEYFADDQDSLRYWKPETNLLEGQVPFHAFNAIAVFVSCC